MLKHHEESVENMVRHYSLQTDINSLILIGSVATETARPDSDIDAIAIVSEEYYNNKKANNELEEVYYGKCTYKGGYFNIHYMTHNGLVNAAKSGSEPLRNMFCHAKVLFTDKPDLQYEITKISVFQKQEAAEKQFQFYCTMRMFYNYFWLACKPKGYAKLHAVNGIIFNLYRLILIENEILFPSARKLEEYVNRAPNKPDNIMQKCTRFIKWMSDDDCNEIIKSYEAWTSYNYPKEHSVVMNNFL